MSEPLMADTKYTVSDWHKRKAKQEKMEAKLEPYFAFICGWIQLGFFIGLLWVGVALIKLFGAHS